MMFRGRITLCASSIIVLERQMLIAGQESVDFMEHDLLTTESMCTRVRNITDGVQHSTDTEFCGISDLLEGMKIYSRKLKPWSRVVPRI